MVQLPSNLLVVTIRFMDGEQVIKTIQTSSPYHMLLSKDERWVLVEDIDNINYMYPAAAIKEVMIVSQEK